MTDSFLRKEDKKVNCKFIVYYYYYYYYYWILVCWCTLCLEGLLKVFSTVCHSNSNCNSNSNDNLV